MIAAIRAPVCNRRRCVQITAFGADDVPDVKISAHRELTSGSRQRRDAARKDAWLITWGSKRIAGRLAIDASVPLRRSRAAAFAAGSSAVPGAGIERAVIRRSKLPDTGVRSGNVAVVPKAAP